MNHRRKNTSRQIGLHKNTFSPSWTIVLRKWKNRPTVGRNILEEHIVYEGLIHKGYRELLNNKTNNPFKNRWKNWTDILSKKKIRIMYYL